MNDRQAIVLTLLLSLGVWVVIWGIIVAIADVLGFLL
jgi:hypothetical protein